MRREIIEWHEPEDGLPPADELVLVTLGESEHGDWDTPSWVGYYDGTNWYSAEGADIDVVCWATMPTGDATPDALITAAPALLALARKYASECADCNGTGRVLFTRQSDKTYECPDCKDIRDAIAAAEGKAT